MNNPAYICKTTNMKSSLYLDSLQSINNKHVCDFALYTPVNSIQRFLARYELMKMVECIPGSIIEMGVCSGNGLMSLIHCHNVIQPTYIYREFYGFDTFEGFPTISTNDIKYIDWKIGDFSNNCFEQLTNIINIHNEYYYAPTKVELIKGDVTKTIPGFLNDNRHIIVSLLYLDLDLYEPTKCALTHFLPKMAKGSIIAFDEINYKQFPGETIAALEILGNKYEFKNLLNSHINYCIIK
jgi:hypothetical protein